MSWGSEPMSLDLPSGKASLRLSNALAGITINVHIPLAGTDDLTRAQITALLKEKVKAALLEAAESLP